MQLVASMSWGEGLIYTFLMLASESDFTINFYAKIDDSGGI
jgi:hypothetical protein